MYTATYLYSALLHRSAGPSGLKKTKTSQNGLVKKVRDEKYPVLNYGNMKELCSGSLFGDFPLCGGRGRKNGMQVNVSTPQTT